MPLRDQNVDLSDTVRERRKKEKSWEDQRFEVYEEKAPWMVRMVMKYSRGYIQSEGQAYAVLWGVAGVCIATAVIVFLLSSDSTTIEQPPEDLINRPQPAEGYIPR